MKKFLLVPILVNVLQQAGLLSRHRVRNRLHDRRVLGSISYSDISSVTPTMVAFFTIGTGMDAMRHMHAFQQHCK